MSVFSKELIVYYRDNCHLCEQVMVSLLKFQNEIGFEINNIDIDDTSQHSEETRLRYTADIPVVMYQDEVIFYHFFDEIALREALA